MSLQLARRVVVVVGEWEACRCVIPGVSPGDSCSNYLPVQTTVFELCHLKNHMPSSQKAGDRPEGHTQAR